MPKNTSPTFSIDGPVEFIDGNLILQIPLSVGGNVLAPLAKGIGIIDGEFLKVIIKPWLAEKLNIKAGDTVTVDNSDGRFTITGSGVDDHNEMQA